MKIVQTLMVSLFPIILSAQQPMNLLIGTYTNSGKSEGIYVYDFDGNTGVAVLKNQVKVANPSYLAMSADEKFVYAVSEQGADKGAISAFAFDRISGKLSLLNTQLTEGASPCHVITDKEAKYVFVSNYRGGKLSVFPIHSDGSLGKLVQVVQHEGNGPDKSRQNDSHIHSAFFDLDEKKLFVQDLGTDKINIYDYQPENASNPLTPAAQEYAKSAAGGGPRHITFGKDGKFVYLVQELTARVMVYAQQEGRLRSIQEIAMNEDGFEGGNGAADIKTSPDGQFLYASNRGDANTIAIYKINQRDGKLTKVANQSVLGKGPRNFNLSPDGRFLLVANQNSDEVVIFSRDGGTGLLTDTGNRIAVGSPVCLVF